MKMRADPARMTGALAALLVATIMGACLGPIEPAALAECRNPTISTDGWTRVGPSVSTFLLPPDFVPSESGGWERGRTRVSISYLSNTTPAPGFPEERELTGGCRATVDERSVAVEFAIIEHTPSEIENHIIASWNGIRTGTLTGRVVFEGMTYDAAELPLLMKMIFSMQITENTGPGSP